MLMKFIEDIKKDIEMYTVILQNNDISEAKKCVKQIEFVYGKRVDGLNGLYRNAVWDGDVDWIDLLRNTIRIIGFYKEEFEIKYIHNQKLGINRVHGSDLEETGLLDIPSRIELVKEKLEGTMSDQAYEDLVIKLDTLKDISQLDISVGKKWLKIRTIIEWALGEGIDVYRLLSPILYATLTEDH